MKLIVVYGDYKRTSDPCSTSVSGNRPHIRPTSDGHATLLAINSILAIACSPLAKVAKTSSISKLLSRGYARLLLAGLCVMSRRCDDRCLRRIEFSHFSRIRKSLISRNYYEISLQKKKKKYAFHGVHRDPVLDLKVPRSCNPPSSAFVCCSSWSDFSSLSLVLCFYIPYTAFPSVPQLSYTYRNILWSYIRNFVMCATWRHGSVN